MTLDVTLAAEALDQAGRHNAAARHQGAAVLRGLGTLQPTLLGGDPRTALAELAQLLTDLPPAPNPRRAEVLNSIALRARVELARHGA